MSTFVPGLRYFPRLSASIALAAGCICILSACSSNITLPDEREFPTPVVGALPLSMGLHFTDEFRNYRHEEEDSKLEVALGEPQVRVFNRVFSSMFREVVPVKSRTVSSGVDAVIEPMIEEFEYLEPAISGSKFYAVSIRYRLSLYSPEGSLIATWPINAYGKSRAKATGLGSGGTLGEATLRAMRDAAAIVATEFTNQQQVKEWLARSR